MNGLLAHLVQLFIIGKPYAGREDKRTEWQAPVTTVESVLKGLACGYGAPGANVARRFRRAGSFGLRLDDRRNSTGRLHREPNTDMVAMKSPKYRVLPSGYWNSPNGVFSIQTIRLPFQDLSEFHSNQIQGGVEYIEDSFNPPESDRVVYLRPRDDVTVNAQCCNSLALCSPSAANERHRGTPTRHLMMSAHGSVVGSTASIAMNHRGCLITTKKRRRPR